jgi:hypothetical protein
MLGQFQPPAQMFSSNMFNPNNETRIMKQVLFAFVATITLAACSTSTEETSVDSTAVDTTVVADTAAVVDTTIAE